MKISAPQFDDEPMNVQQVTLQYKRFKFNQFADDLDKPVLAHLVKDVIQQGSLGLLIAQEKSGKSFVAIELAVHISAGKEEWRGRRIAKACRGMPVIYISGEGAAGFRQRKKALAQWFGISKELQVLMPFYDLQVAPNLSDPSTIVDLIHDIGLIGKPVLIVIDTLARTIFGNENDAESMTNYVNNCSEIQRSLGCALLIVHHIPKSSQNGTAGQVTSRGSNVLPASADSCLKIELEEDGKKLLEVFWAKDIGARHVMQFRLKPVDVGVDDEGEVVTSCIIEEVGTETTPEAYARKSGRSKGEGGRNEKDW